MVVFSLRPVWYPHPPRQTCTCNPAAESPEPFHRGGGEQKIICRDHWREVWGPVRNQIHGVPHYLQRE